MLRRRRRRPRPVRHGFEAPPITSTDFVDSPAPDATTFESTVRFAGRTADGLIGVHDLQGQGAIVRYFDADLVERPELEQTFTSSTTIQGIEIESGGLGQIWVDEFRLFHLGPDQFEARSSTTRSTAHGSSNPRDGLAGRRRLTRATGRAASRSSFGPAADSRSAQLLTRPTASFRAPNPLRSPENDPRAQFR